MDTLKSIKAFRSGNVRIYTRIARPSSGLRPKDRLLAEREEPALGSHLVTPRRGYAHHGIYIGRGRVIHYGALVRGLHWGPVEEVPVARFTHGHTLWLRPHESARFDCQEVIRRARSRIGEDCYRLLSNNCEHFCEWCAHGEHRSEQVEMALSPARRLARIANAVAAALLALTLQRRVFGAGGRNVRPLSMTGEAAAA